MVDLPAEIQVSAVATALSTFGLNSPSVEFHAIDQKGRERGHLLLGKRERGLVYAMGAGLPGVHQARSAILTQIPSKQALMAESGNR